MNGLVAYDSSGSEDEEPVAPPAAAPKPKKVLIPEKVSVKSETMLGRSLLTSEYQLRMLSKQRSKDAVFFNLVRTSGQNLTPEMIFSNDELHIILKIRNLEICEHSSFFNY